MTKDEIALRILEALIRQDEYGQTKVADLAKQAREATEVLFTPVQS